MTAPACATSGREDANATEPFTAWLSAIGADCITGPDPKGERGGGALETGKECDTGDELREGAEDVRGADDAPLLIGLPLATELSSSSRGRRRWAWTSFIRPSSR